MGELATGLEQGSELPLPPLPFAEMNMFMCPLLGCKGNRFHLNIYIYIFVLPCWALKGSDLATGSIFFLRGTAANGGPTRVLLLEVPQRVFLVVSLQSHPIKAKLTVFFQESDVVSRQNHPKGTLKNGTPKLATSLTSPTLRKHPGVALGTMRPILGGEVDILLHPLSEPRQQFFFFNHVQEPSCSISSAWGFHVTRRVFVFFPPQRGGASRCPWSWGAKGGEA